MEENSLTRISEKLTSVKALKKSFQSFYDVIYPIGKARKVQFLGEDNPNTSLPLGIVAKWEVDANYNDKFIKVDNTVNVGTTGGNKTNALSELHLPQHNHGETSGNDGNHSHTGTTDWQGGHTHDHQGGYKLSDGDRSSGLVVTSDNYEGGAKFPMSENGNHQHIFDTNEEGSHSHSINYQGNSAAFNQEPTYKTIVVWKRVS